MTETTYADQIESLAQQIPLRAITAKPVTLSELMEVVIPGQPENTQIECLLPVCKVTQRQYEGALAKKAKELETVIQAAERTDKIVFELGAVPATVQDYVRLYTERKGLSAKYNGAMTGGDDDVTTMLAVDLRLLRDELKLSFNDRAVEDGIARWLSNARKERLTAVKALISQPVDDDDRDVIHEQLVDLCRMYFLDTEEHPAEMAAALLKKTVWQVKRKMFGIEVTNHLMIVLTGIGKTGKSTFNRKLTSPVEEMRAAADFDQVTDNRNITLWSNYVLLMDEMAKSAKAEMDTVKSIISMDEITRRVMATNRVVPVQQNVVFVGDSNYRLSEIIFDYTGIRKFGEIRVNPNAKGNMEVFDAINAFSWFKLWQSVDHYGEDPMKPWTQKLEAQQEDNRNRDTIEQYIDYAVEKPLWFHAEKTDGGFYEITSSAMYEDYKEWVSTNCPGFRPSTLAFWGRRMNSQDRIERVRGKHGVFFRLPTKPSPADALLKTLRR